MSDVIDDDLYNPVEFDDEEFSHNSENRERDKEHELRYQEGKDDERSRGRERNEENERRIRKEDKNEEQPQHGNNDKDVPEDGKMFVGGLDWSVTDEELQKYFSRFGQVLSTSVMRDGTGRSRGFAFLTFADRESVDRCLAKEKHILHGKPIDPKRALAREEQEKAVKLFVGGLPQDVTLEEFRAFFLQYGKVVDATLVTDRETGRSRGFGFVSLEGGVEQVLAETDLKMRDKTIEVKRADTRHKPKRAAMAAAAATAGQYIPPPLLNNPFAAQWGMDPAAIPSPGGRYANNTFMGGMRPGMPGAAGNMAAYGRFVGPWGGMMNGGAGYDQAAYYRAYAQYASMSGMGYGNINAFGGGMVGGSLVGAELDEVGEDGNSGGGGGGGGGSGAGRRKGSGAIHPSQGARGQRSYQPYSRK
ncbi:uncharacterized protein VTP21DRAFT_4322 [Calcarisporiella thermophila]|uniref:uncharacterized protein n=1 Tax=Calcarisporiella thermophila TaxID=911321 RepID=UPI0037422A77